MKKGDWNYPNIVQTLTPVSLENKLQRNPSRRTKSRWEPLLEEKLVEKPASVNHSTLKYSGWAHANERDKKCQSQLQSLYAEGIEGCLMEFSAYNLLCVILHSSNNRDLVSSMSRLSSEAKRDNAVRHALAVRAAVTSGNNVMFFRLFKTAPNLNTCLMDLYVEKMRFKAVCCISRSYWPVLPVSYIAQVLGFSNVASDNDEKDSDGLEECIEWLKAHGACLIVDNNGEMQLDAKIQQVKCKRKSDLEGFGVLTFGRS
ncbi:SAC3 family protein A-like [Humulus lupulus]|uniref:SAC3 family protein A-like n=1 Tax=Humulus lupulus TaxID=3486 RepID=UPI002B4067AB|nr:SAC3 family protein A-like [Humulus lupulus]XP_062078018.1 SAC3 family protein A-like [Humulus lupulus]XP_062078019.1 SAC3 family protein A-like [Humulus lupulus]XP_062078020.1 SAC3 family protein A-like [Humulus lupulus]XP_062078021.1 SAC3 family protein A-like [Humulus lupulus]XP_062078022.1 SAC3 family protein A-like [Humulus lupulus]